MSKEFKSNDRFEILTPDGFQNFKGVLRQQKTGMHLFFDDNTDIICTPSHVFIDGNSPISAENIYVGFTLNGKVITKIENLGVVDVYDPIEVENGNLYISNGLVSHNCNFIGASNTLISGNKLRTIPFDKPVAVSDTMRIYAEPKDGDSYVINVDTSRGTGNDYSAYTVINVQRLPYTVDAVYADNMVSPLLLPGLILNIAKKYNEAQVLVETNDIGESIASSLYYDYEYENVIMSNTNGEISAFGGEKPGLRTTKKTKSLGCSVLKTLIENDQLIIRDSDILYELSNFALKGQSYEAENGHDDRVMTLVLFAYLTTQPIMPEISSQSAKARIIELRQKQTEEAMLPAGFFVDGTETEMETFNF